MANPISGIGAGRAAGVGLDIAGELTPRPGAGRPSATQRDAFTDTLTRVLNELSSTVDDAGELQQRYLRGENVEVHQVMAATEEAGLALDLTTALRDKVVEAYRTLVNMS